MLELSEAVHRYGEKQYVDAALRACTYWHQQYASWGHNQADPSALTIAAVALLRLWQHLSEKLWLYQQSCWHIQELLAPDVVQTGVFVGHHYQTHPDVSERAESPLHPIFPA